MRGIEPLRGRVDEITPLRDGRRNDANGRVCELRDQRLRLARFDEIDHRACNARLLVACVLLDVQVSIRTDARMGYGHCSRMQWADGRWQIAPGSAPSCPAGY